MKTNLTKILIPIFLIIVAGMLITHYVIMHTTLQVTHAEFASTQAALNGQISQFQKKLEDLTTEKQVLEVKLGIAEIRDDVTSSNYGIARESVIKLRTTLVENGCQKMDQLTPVFEKLDTALLKKNDTVSLASLDEIYSIIFPD